MFIKPTTAIKNGWIKGDFTDKNIQPNAIDFTIDKLHTIHTLPFRIDEENKKMRGGDPVGTEFDAEWGNHYWKLAPRTTYDFMSNFYLNIPEGVACLLIVRSTFNRNGIFITSGLYDSGFKGHIAGALHNNSGPAFIAPGTRLGQIIFVESKNVKMYDGGYNHDKGTHYTDHKTAPQDLDCDGADARDRKRGNDKGK